MTSPADRNLASQPSLFDRIFRDSEGNIVIGQKPNLPAVVAVVATLLQAILPSGTLQTAIVLIAFGTWYTWAWQELFAGVNYFRRSLGLLTLVGLIALTLNLISRY
ncbi:hypothetical protein IQ273_31925 [Nodosilinea sp. LEGE 07298]|uniref:hypothetical protein n=1 Tax=Nodosilinea sp. LEGE 07298 TaxID=2777970 RepID=UPI00188135B7|nr:hypothetical protein [Nodosilinea sp. LEGE 07298]MBE9113980.1 hypothetical protein [Nodosilinea sp. LEGE 07298]